MSLATFQDLCLDAAEPSVLGLFWSAALGLDLHDQGDGDVDLTGPSKAHRIWINQVPEPKVSKHRIHLDVYGESVESLRTLGATTVDDESFAWTVMADPEGGEFCLFIRDDPPTYRLYEVSIDCADHEATSIWWAEAIGGQRTIDSRGFSCIEEIPNAPFSSLCFASVDEPKTTKNRIHLDVTAETVDPLIEAGATMLRRRDGEISWDVLADPEGNEFCVFPRR